MAGVCLFFEGGTVDVFSGSPKDLNAWNYAVCASSNLNKVHVINRTEMELGFPFGSGAKTHSEGETLPFLQTDTVAQICCPWEFDDSEPLWTFDHEVDWYFFGPSSGWKNYELPKAQYKRIHIPQKGQGALHGAHIGSIVLLHRYWVNGRNSNIG